MAKRKAVTKEKATKKRSAKTAPTKKPDPEPLTARKARKVSAKKDRAKPSFRKVPGSSAWAADARWQCHHCKTWVEADEPHDCWTTTEAALTAELSDDLREAWERFREAAVEIGEQRIYASGTAIMFSRRVCHFFVRPRRSFLEVCLFLGRTVKGPQVRRAVASSRTRVAHTLQIRHRDEVEAPLTDWLAEAYELSL